MRLRRIITVFLCLTLSLNASSQHNCDYKIDTARILSNEGLNKFLSEFQSDSFKVSNNKKDIPKFIRKQLKCLVHNFSIANPGQSYQATDAVSWRIKPLPHRQLVFLAKSDSILVMTYFKGGIGRSSHALFIKFKNRKILDLWTGLCLNGMETKQGIIDEMNRNKNKKLELNTGIVTF